MVTPGGKEPQMVWRWGEAPKERDPRLEVSDRDPARPMHHEDEQWCGRWHERLGPWEMTDERWDGERSTMMDNRWFRDRAGILASHPKVDADQGEEHDRRDRHESPSRTSRACLVIGLDAGWPSQEITAGNVGDRPLELVRWTLEEASVPLGVSLEVDEGIEGFETFLFESRDERDGNGEATRYFFTTKTTREPCLGEKWPKSRRGFSSISVSSISKRCVHDPVLLRYRAASREWG